MDTLLIAIGLTLIVCLSKSLYDDKKRIKAKYKSLHQQPDYYHAPKPAKPKRQKGLYDKHNFSPYQKESLLTPTERDFYIKLIHEAYGRKLFICPKVRLEDVIGVKKHVNNYENYRENVKPRHIDFILINTQFNTVAGIELDDPSHDNPRAQEIDEFKNGLFKAVGIPLFRIKVCDDYTGQLNALFTELNCKVG